MILAILLALACSFVMRFKTSLCWPERLIGFLVLLLKMWCFSDASCEVRLFDVWDMNRIV